MALDTKLSIIIITFRRTELLKRCLVSIYKSLLPEKYEIIIIINGNDPETEQGLRSDIIAYPNLQLFTIKKTTNGSARNEAVKRATGAIIYFLDDDVVVNDDFFENAIRKLDYYKDANIVGGPNLTPGQSSLFQRSSGYVLASVFGAADTRRRWSSIGKDVFVNDSHIILCNLAVRKKVFDNEKIGFDSDLTCAEENLLIQQLRAKGHKVLYSPELIVFHERRRNIKEFATQIFKYGRGRAQLILRSPSSLPFLNLFPSLFVLYLASLILFRHPVYLLLLLAYLVMNVSFSVLISYRHKNIALFPLLFILFVVEHMAYGLGFLFGLTKQLK